MAEREIEDRDGVVWNAGQWAMFHGWKVSEERFAETLTDIFGVEGYERFQDFWRLRDAARMMNTRGVPEGADINDYL